MPAVTANRFALALSGALYLAVSPASAAIIDPQDDFLRSFSGTRGRDLDVRTADVTLDDSRFTLSATLDGALGATPNALYVWGLNRGAGAERFVAGTPSVGQGVSFDSVVILRPDGTGSFTDLVAGTPATALTAGSVQASGSTITGVLPTSLAPSRGFAAADYVFNLWPRQGAGSNDQIADFAPDASSFRATATAVGATPGVAVPEPASLSLLGLAMAGLATLRRRAA